MSGVTAKELIDKWAKSHVKIFSKTNATIPISDRLESLGQLFGQFSSLGISADDVAMRIGAIYLFCVPLKAKSQSKHFGWALSCAKEIAALFSETFPNADPIDAEKLMTKTFPSFKRHGGVDREKELDSRIQDVLKTSFEYDSVRGKIKEASGSATDVLKTSGYPALDLSAFPPVENISRFDPEIDKFLGIELKDYNV